MSSPLGNPESPLPSSHSACLTTPDSLKNRDKPIFTLTVPFSRIYIVTDPSLAAAVQRASKALSFTPLVPDVTNGVKDSALEAQIGRAHV